MSASSFNPNQKVGTTGDSPKLWGGILIVTIILFFVFTLPHVSTWIEQNNDLKTLPGERNALQQEKDLLDKQLINVEKEFESLASPYLAAEEKTFPAVLDSDKISKSFEIYSLLASIADRKTFEIKTLSFGESTYNEELEANELSVSLTFTASQASAQKFIGYLQTNKLPTEILQSGEFELRNFIKNNPLPIATIQNLNFEEQTDDPSLQSVTMQLDLFGQPIQPETKK